MKQFGIKKLVLAALFGALAYIGFAFLRIDIPIGFTKTAFHLGNIFVILASLILGGWVGGLSGSIGLTLADLTSGYALYAPTTFVLKLGIGLVCGLVAHKFGKINTLKGKKLVKWTAISTSSAMLFNIIFDPLLSYIRVYVLTSIGVAEIAGKAIKPMDIAGVMVKIVAATTFTNAVISIVVVSIIFPTILGVLRKMRYELYYYKSKRGKIDE